MRPIDDLRGGVRSRWQDSSRPEPKTGFGEWTHYGGNAASQKYSPLDQINKDTIGKLTIAWRWASPDNAVVAANPMSRPGGVSRHAVDGEGRALHGDVARADRGDQSGNGPDDLAVRSRRTGRPGVPATLGSCIAASRTGVTATRSACCSARTTRT